MKTIIVLVSLVMSASAFAATDVKQLDIREVRDCIKIAKAMDRTERQVEKLDVRLDRLVRLMDKANKNNKRSDIQYQSYERMVKSRNKQTYFYRDKFREYQDNCNGVYVEKSVLDKTCRNSTHNTFCEMFK